VASERSAPPAGPEDGDRRHEPENERGIDEGQRTPAHDRPHRRFASLEFIEGVSLTSPAAARQADDHPQA
jgi:hypothetical protein